jgi:hypothetical protein
MSCDIDHKLMPKKRNKQQWTRGRKLVILTDQNFPAALPSLDGKCPAIIRVEGGLLSELGDFFYSLLKDFTLPEGSVLMIGSLSPHGRGPGGICQGIGNGDKKVLQAVLLHSPRHPLHPAALLRDQ